MITLIIGRQSNLSEYVCRELDKVTLLSSRELMKDITLLKTFKNKKLNIIFNNFQAATKLNSIENGRIYIDQSITVTALILDYVKNWNINKIIYSSSGSVYGNNDYCSEEDNVHPINLHAALKISNEFFISQYCKTNDIDYTIIRIFNMYGGHDKFSVISKILDSYKNKTVLNIVNGGQGIRDFIHIDDVVYIILKLLKIKSTPIINLGTGNKKSVKSILKKLKENNIDIEIKDTISNKEIKTSVSNTEKLLSIMNKEFIKVEDYLLKELEK